jgi:hypothetical protein
LAKKGTTRSILATPLFDHDRFGVGCTWSLSICFLACSYPNSLQLFKVTIHEPHVSASNCCLEMQLRVIYRFRRSASDGPAGREVVFGPIVKRETVVNASAAVPAAIG